MPASTTSYYSAPPRAIRFASTSQFKIKNNLSDYKYILNMSCDINKKVYRIDIFVTSHYNFESQYKKKVCG